MSVFGKYGDQADKVIKRLLKSAIPQTDRRHKWSYVGLDYGWRMSLQDRLDFRVLDAWTAGRVNREAAMTVLSVMKAEDEIDVEHFGKRLQSWRESLPSPHRYKFVFPFRVLLEDVSLPQDFKVFGCKVTITNWQGATVGIGRARLERMFSKSRIPQDRREVDTCLVTRASGINGISAAEAAEKTVDTLRGMFELSMGAGSSSLMWPSRGRRKIPHPSWAIGWSKAANDLQPIIFLVDDLILRDAHRHALKPFPLKRKSFEQILENLEAVAKDVDEGSTSSLIGDALRLYVQAMDAYSDDDCFLGLWQCAEVLTAASERGGNDDVCSRLTALLSNLGLPAANINAVLRDYSRRRNRIVHRGMAGQVDQDEANLFKVIIDNALLSVLQKIEELPTRVHLDHYLRCLEANDRDLDSAVRTLKAQLDTTRLVIQRRQDSKKQDVAPFTDDLALTARRAAALPAGGRTPADVPRQGIVRIAFFYSAHGQSVTSLPGMSCLSTRSGSRSPAVRSKNSAGLKAAEMTSSTGDLLRESGPTGSPSPFLQYSHVFRSA